MKLLKVGDKIGIVCCSNGQRRDYREKIKRLESTLVEIGLEPVFSKYIYEKNVVSIKIEKILHFRFPHFLGNYLFF